MVGTGIFTPKLRPAVTFGKVSLAREVPCYCKHTRTVKEHEPAMKPAHREQQWERDQLWQYCSSASHHSQAILRMHTTSLANYSCYQEVSSYRGSLIHLAFSWAPSYTSKMSLLTQSLLLALPATTGTGQRVLLQPPASRKPRATPRKGWYFIYSGRKTDVLHMGRCWHF